MKAGLVVLVIKVYTNSRKKQGLGTKNTKKRTSIIERYPAIEKEYSRLELEKNGNTQRQKDAFASLRPLVRARPDLNR